MNKKFLSLYAALGTLTAWSEPHFSFAYQEIFSKPPQEKHEEIKAMTATMDHFKTQHMSDQEQITQLQDKIARIRNLYGDEDSLRETMSLCMSSLQREEKSEKKVEVLEEKLKENELSSQKKDLDLKKER